MGEAKATDWPLVGRREERDLLIEAFTEQQWGGVVIAGGVGVGKTRLAREVLDEFAGEGRDVQWIAGTRAAAGIPFGAVAPLLPAPRRPLDGGPSVDTVAEIRSAVEARAATGRVVLGVDDAHCLDDASAVVVQQLAVIPGTFVVVTLRSGEPTSDAVTSLWKDGLAERIELQPLSDADVRELLPAVLGGPVAEPCVAELVRASGGNCLYLRELVRTATETGSLAREDGAWRWRSAPPPSPRLLELVDDRTRHLDDGARAVVELVAVGEPVALAALEHLCDPHDLDDAVRHELIRIETVGRRTRVRLGHPIYGEVLRDRLPATAVRRHCQALADTLATTGMRRAGDALRYVTWRLDAGLGAEAALLLDAYRQALEGNDLAAAERFAIAAADAATDRDARVQATLAVADARVRRLRIAEALAGLDALDGPDAGPVTDGQTVDIAVARANLLLLAGRPDTAVAHLRAAEDRVTAPYDRARLRLVRARHVGAGARPEEALALLAEAAVLAPGADLEPWDLPVRGPALAFTGRFDDAEAVAHRGLDPGFKAGGEVTVAVDWVASVLGLVSFGRGELEETAGLAELMLGDGLSSGHRARRRAGAAIAGWVRFWQGDLDRAFGLLREGISHDGGLESDGVRVLAWAGLAGAHALAGDLHQADATLAQAHAEERPPIRWFDDLLVVPRALIAHRRGSTSEARRVIGEGLASTGERGLRTIELCLVATALRVGAADLARRSLLRSLVPTVQTPLAGVLLDQAEATVAADPARLLAVADELEGRALTVMAVEVSAAAAAIFERTGRRGDARRAMAVARQRADGCTGVDLGFLDAPDQPTRLTRRELEVARLAAAGYASGDIAAQLYISTRTVDTHLGRVYVKLGIRSRRSLVRALESRAPTGEGR